MCRKDEWRTETFQNQNSLKIFQQLQQNAQNMKNCGQECLLRCGLLWCMKCFSMRFSTFAFCFSVLAWIRAFQVLGLRSTITSTEMCRTTGKQNGEFLFCAKKTALCCFLVHFGRRARGSKRDCPDNGTTWKTKPANRNEVGRINGLWLSHLVSTFVWWIVESFQESGSVKQLQGGQASVRPSQFYQVLTLSVAKCVEVPQAKQLSKTHLSSTRWCSLFSLHKEHKIQSGFCSTTNTFRRTVSDSQYTGREGGTPPPTHHQHSHPANRGDTCSSNWATNKWVGPFVVLTELENSRGSDCLSNREQQNRSQNRSLLCDF